MSVMTGCIRCGIRLNCESSTILGSIRSSFTSSGRRVIRIDRIMAFKQTDLPVPVRPAISRWGISARSKYSGCPLTSLPRNRGIRMRLEVARAPWITSSRRTVQRLSLGTSMPTVVLPGMGETIRTLGTASAIARSFASPTTRETRKPGFELDFEHGDDRACIDLHDPDDAAVLPQRLLQHQGALLDQRLLLLHGRVGRRFQVINGRR